MNISALKTIRLGLGLAALLFCAAGSALAACPKVLMFDGVNILTQNNAEQARYWGHTVGVQGFFLNNLMAYWQQDVGDSSAGSVWRQAKQFQDAYAVAGVADNFIKVAIWRSHNWHRDEENAQVVSHFAHAAALARYAGFKGMALDLEPYVPIWGGAAGGPELAATVQTEGEAIARGMHDAYPGMSLVLIQDNLYWAGRGQEYHGGYGLSVPFVRGLLSVPWSQVVIATEHTYDGYGIASSTAQTLDRYEAFITQNNLPVQHVSVAPGLWPLGKSYEDKSARVSASEFAQWVHHAMTSTTGYVWIYGFGSAWQTDGPYGKGPAVSGLADYARAVLQARHACAAD